MKPMQAKATAATPDKEWQKTPYSNLIRYVPSGIYYARLRVKGKLIRKSLKTDMLAVGKLRLGDFEKQERQRAEKAERRKADAKLRAQKRAEKQRVCNDLIQDPPSDPELVFGTACWDFSSFHRFQDGSWEGEISQRAGKNFPKTWDRLEKFLRPLFQSAKGWWMRVGVFGVEPSELGKGEPDFDRDRYQKSRKTWGKAFVPGSIGRHSPWRRIRRSQGGKRTKFTTPATILLAGRQITERFARKGFQSVVLSVQVYTGNERPSGD
jgi:hypothetical protein